MADPTALYSYKGDSPTTLPYKIKLSDGSVHTDISTFTDEELTDAGFTGPYVVPSHNETQTVTWDSSNLKYVVEDINDDELWAMIRKERNRLLSESDWMMICDMPGDKGINLPEWNLYRIRLRDLPATTSNPREIVWPLSPDDPEYLKDFDPPILEESLRTRTLELEGHVEDLKSANRNKTATIQDLVERIVALEAKVGTSTT